MALQIADIMRPSSLDELIGNEHIKKVLQGQFAEGNISHTFLVTGKYGSGKTTIARIIANKLEAQTIEHDAGAISDIESVRDIVKSSYTTSLWSSSKVYIIDEVHKLSKDAQTAFLKVTEEPPQDVYFIFCTSEPQKIIPALASRCVKLEVEPVSIDGIRSAVSRVMKRYNIEVENRQDWLRVVEQGEESLRVVYNHIERLIAAGKREGDKIVLTSELFDELLPKAQEVDEDSELVKAILKGGISEILRQIDIAKKGGAKPFETTLGIYRYLRKAAPINKRAILADLAYILATKEMANSWEGLEYVVFKNP